MEAFIFTLLCILWFISGVASFIYWWTKEFDFTWEEFPLMIVCGIFGPFTFVGALIFYYIFKNGSKEEKEPGVLFKKRKKSS